MLEENVGSDNEFGGRRKRRAAVKKRKYIDDDDDEDDDFYSEGSMCHMLTIKCK